MAVHCCLTSHQTCFETYIATAQRLPEAGNADSESINSTEYAEGHRLSNALSTMPPVQKVLIHDWGSGAIKMSIHGLAL